MPSLRRLTIRLAAPAMTLGLLGAGAACAWLDDYRTCPAPLAADPAALPARLSDTGLYADIASETLRPGVLAFTPRFPLWSDGAAKRRWIWLPPGTRIDTRDQDAWMFPPGTRLWKEFRRDGVRVETRLLVKLGAGPEAWAAMAYLWDRQRPEAVAAPRGAEDVGGTEHDVPAARDCMGCHGGRASRVLGFSAVQLAFDAPAGQVDLADLIAAGLLTDPPARPPRVPGTAQQQAALGYLHGNCSHCHNQRRPQTGGPRCFDPQLALDFTLPAAPLAAVEQTPTYQSAPGLAFDPGNAPDSDLIERMRSRRNPFFAGMPPLATELPDHAAIALLSSWIDGFPPKQKE
jgi:hypothetical protein